MRSKAEARVDYRYRRVEQNSVRRPTAVSRESAAKRSAASASCKAQDNPGFGAQGHALLELVVAGDTHDTVLGHMS